MGESKPVILVVEDDALLRMVAADTLEEHGFGVVEAANADAALKMLETRDDVRLLFTDIQMPGSCDGMDLARQAQRSLAQHPPGHHLRPNKARSSGNSRRWTLRRQALSSERTARPSRRSDAQTGITEREAEQLIAAYVAPGSNRSTSSSGPQQREADPILRLALACQSVPARGSNLRWRFLMKRKRKPGEGGRGEQRALRPLPPDHVARSAPLKMEVLHLEPGPANGRSRRRRPNASRQFLRGRACKRDRTRQRRRLRSPR